MLNESSDARQEKGCILMRMKLIESQDELLKNISILQDYLSGMDVSDRRFAESLIEKGKCFVCIFKDGTYSFFPSRFIGYTNNKRSKHLTGDIDGRITNRTISRILQQKLSREDSMEIEYEKFCHRLGVRVTKYTRKYWPSVLTPIG